MDEAWKDFVVSGKVSDYLRSKNVEADGMQDTAMEIPREERPDGAEYHRDRNGLKCNADWRI